ncbi:MAG: hypothetical protein ACLPY3_14500 [Solirubrobacteraceae bacterium]
MFAGTVTVAVALPPLHVTVLGSPETVGVTENAQLVAPVTLAARSIAAPWEVAVNEVTAAATPATVTVTGEAFTVVDPFADRANVYVFVAVVVLAGTVTDTEALPDVHDTVLGSPVTAGVEENTQLVASVTVADNTTDPPVCGRVATEAVNELTTGAG